MPTLPQQPWTLASCQAQDQRDALVNFWLAAPEDLLPSLWSSPVGEVTKQLIRELTDTTQFHAHQVELRDAVGLRLQAGFHSPMAIQLLIAAFLYSPPALLKIADAASQLPAWLLPDYLALYETGGQSSSTGSQPVASEQRPATELPAPDFGQFPATLQELVQNRIQLNRLLGLSNLYYIDPEDQEILGELRQVRISLVEAIQRCSESDLQALWATDLGDRYWALVRSGIQKEPLTPVEENFKHQASQRLNPSAGGGFGTPGAINAILIAMTFFEPGTMRVNNAEQQLPSWLLPSYQQIYAEPLVQQQS